MQGESDIEFPPFRLDVRAEKLWRDTQEVTLRPKTFALLRYLAEHPERLIRKEELVRNLWGETCINTEGLRDYIREIRYALNDAADAPRFVETVRGRGYRFVGRVASSQQSVASRTEDSRNNGQGKNRVTLQQPTSPTLLTIRGVYDGKEIRALPTEALPDVRRETLVLIVFLENESVAKENGRQEP
jgi:DNA-binding winged helix-turn-helix (wHTH) protein